MAADVCGRSLYDLRKLVEANPRKGSAEAIRSLQPIDAALVIGVLDNDKIRTQPNIKPLLNASASVSCREAANAVWKFAKEPPLTVVVLLRENAESVVDAVAQCLTLEAEVLRRARAKKRDARDIVFKNAAHAPSEIRDCILRRLPSLAIPPPT